MSTQAADLKSLRSIPNIGKSMAQDLYDLGYRNPEDLKGEDPLRMYKRLCEQTKSRQDPCVLDTFMAAVHYAETGERRDWWAFTPERKRTYSAEL